MAAPPVCVFAFEALCCRRPGIGGASGAVEEAVKEDLCCWGTCRQLHSRTSTRCSRATLSEMEFWILENLRTWLFCIPKFKQIPSVLMQFSPAWALDLVTLTNKFGCYLNQAYDECEVMMCNLSQRPHMYFASGEGLQKQKWSDDWSWICVNVADYCTSSVRATATSRLPVGR